MAGNTTLEQCLREGFIDYHVVSDPRYVPKILTNNRTKRVKVLDAIMGQLYTCQEFFFSVAFITKSGLACLKDGLIHNHKARGKILASQYLNFTEPNALRDILKFKNIELRMMTEEKAFHAKGYLFHHAPGQTGAYTMVIGSSNLTANALTSNQEWNVFFTSAEHGALIKQAQDEFAALWDCATPVDEAWIDTYQSIYRQNRPSHHVVVPFHRIQPNRMQQEALAGIEEVRKQGEDRGLLISATGTGKTYLSAFDVKKCQPRRFLFLVHRELIARKALESYVNVGFSKEKLGLVTGHVKEIDKPYLFATIQTMAQDEMLHSFKPTYFDYIVVDEVHHGGAKTYQTLFHYFRPKFWLGMTATPERADGFDIYDVFHHQIAYEIRLHQALEENMLVPFHYHGISEIQVNGQTLDDKSDFNALTCEARVQHILHYADLYGSDTDRVKGLVFCNRVDVAKTLADAFRHHGKRAIALTGESSERERADAIAHLGANPADDPDYLDYILTRDIFNEGVDIPEVNQIILLRPTQSAIVFVQQLGRGLRKFPGKRYVEVLDFIGNYEGNFLLPIALYGDRTYDKDFVRNVMHTNFLPGATSVYFDDVAKERIYEAINQKKALADLRALKRSYEDLSYRLGRLPLMMDFVRFGDKDPSLFMNCKQGNGSLYGFSQYMNPDDPPLPAGQEGMLQFLSQELSNGKRVEELVVLQYLLDHDTLTTAALAALVKKEYGWHTTRETMDSVANVLTMNFLVLTARQKYGNMPLISYAHEQYSITDAWRQMVTNEPFRTYVKDILAYGFYRFLRLYKGHEQDVNGGFIRYERYSRKDVSRLLCYDKNREGTLNGYAVVGKTCPIFVTYEKRDDITANTKYEDRFISPDQFSWLTRARVKLTSQTVANICDSSVRKLLFIKKNDAEGKDFYYLGDVTVKRRPVETTITDDHGNKLPIVNFRFSLDVPVEEKLYGYLNS